jgi:hypothetical protein
MLSVKSNFCQKPLGVFPLCKTSFYQCIHPECTDAYSPVCTAHDKSIALNYQILHCPNYNGSSNQEGHSTYLPFNWAKNDYQKRYQKLSLNPSLILPKII